MLAEYLRSWRDRRSTGRTAARRRSAIAGGIEQPRPIETLEPRCLLAANIIPGGFDVTQVATGFYLPTSMTIAPDGRLFVTEKGGAVKIVENGQVLPTPFLTVPANTYSERGLQSILFDPDFEQNGYVYVYYTHASPIYNRLSRFTVSNWDPNVADPASEVVLLNNILATGGLHNGGSMHWGNDGMMYLGVGDALIESTVQDMTSLSGKVLRLDVRNYPNSIVPADNPYVNTPGVRPEIFAVGFRNPFTSAIQPSTGRLFVNDVGAATWEEVNWVQAGHNYGWPIFEGAGNNPAYTNPIHQFNHNGGDAAVTGAVFYEANQFPASYFGSYFFTNFVSGEIFRMDPNTFQVTTFATGAPTTVDFDVAADGSMYYVNLGLGAIYRISYVGSGNRTPTAIAQADVHYGPAPLTVNFTAAQSSDPDGDHLTYHWNFGDGSPVVTGRDVSHTFTTNGIYQVRVTVNDGRGGVHTSAPVQIAAGESPPQPAILQPTVATRYSGGDVIAFSGAGFDVQDGNLPDSAFSWTIVFHHATHTHPFIGPIQGVKSGTFTIPNLGETDFDVWYRVILTVTDSAGLKSSTHVDIFPNLTHFTLATNVPGLQLALEGGAIASGTTISSVVGVTRTFAAPAFQILPTGIYLFDNWSNGGASTQTINVPAGNPTYTANYTQVVAGFDNFYYVQDLYQTLVKRSPTAEEFAAALTQLGSGVSRQQIADELWNSVEHRQLQVDAMYLLYLDRMPAPGERNPLVNAMRNGMTEADAALTLVNGPEYVFRININTNDIILLFMYRNILGRDLDSAGRREYLTKLNNGSLTRAQVSSILMNSDERWRKTINEYYLAALGRPADTAGRNYYLSLLRSGAITERQFASILLSSDEAVRRGILARANPDDVKYVNALYTQLQGRGADNTGLAQFTAELATGASRADIAAKIRGSAEFLGRIVDTLYATYLQRPADPGGRAHWIERLQTDLTEEDASAAFLASAEYATRYGGGDAAFVDSLYRDVLRRGADPGGRAHWIGQLEGGLSRLEVARAMLGSAESFGRLIDAYYSRYLRRGADAGGRDYYLQRYLDGTIDSWSLGNTLIASDEFFARF